MVKAYLKYLPAENGGRMGVIASPTCGDVAWVDRRGVVVLTASLDALTIWNLRTGTMLACLRDETVASPSAVTALACQQNEGKLVAGGHANGSVRLWDRVALSLVVTLEGHRSSVSCISWQADGTTLASGSLDTDIIVWDTVQECGLYRLRGHKDAVTCMSFFSTPNGEGAARLASGSKDGLVKVWDVAQQNLVCGGQDAVLHMWAFKKQGPCLLGTVPKASKARAAKLAFCAEDNHLVCQTADKNVQLFRVRQRDEALHKMRRRLKRKRESDVKAAEADGTTAPLEQQPCDESPNQPSATDTLEAVNVLSASAKIRAISVLPHAASANARNTPLKVLCVLNNNALEVFNVPTRRPELPSVASSFHTQAHRADVRGVALSEQEGLAIACAGEEVKVWSLRSQQCVQTVQTKVAMCCCLLPGDRYALVGCKSGEIQIMDVAASELVETIEEAHSGTVWALCMHPSGKTIMSAGADKTMKVWQIGILTEPSGAKRLTLAGSQSVEMDDDIMALCTSACGRFCALALLDATIRILHMDTFKSALSLYGHRLPALSLDISDDSALCCSGSADKNIKIWGLDFGDCHKSLFAHNDSVMSVKFVPKTHYLWSGGKDGVVKMWDCDKFVQVVAIRAHMGPVWCIAISASGGILMSGGGDRALRVWERSEEQVFIEEERQKELDELLEGGDPDMQQRPAAAEGDGSAVPVADQSSVGCRDAAERILDALEICNFPQDSLQRRLLAKPAHVMLLDTFSSIRQHLLSPAVSSLPFAAVVRVLQELQPLCAQGGTCQKVSVVVNVIVRVHGIRLGGEHPLLLKAVMKDSRKGLQSDSARLGVNLAALKAFQRRLASESDKIPDKEDLVKK